MWYHRHFHPFIQRNNTRACEDVYSFFRVELIFLIYSE